MIDFLLLTEIRVDELVRLNIEDIDFTERECVVYGKGDKVSLNRPHNRLTESGVELRLREMRKN